MPRILGTLVALGFLTATASAQFQTGHIFIGDFNGVVWEVDPVTFGVTTFADTSDGLSGTSAVAFTPSHRMLTSNFNTNQVIEFDASGNGNVVLGPGDGLDGPFGENGIAIDKDGQIYVGNYTGQDIRRYQSDYSGGVVFADATDGLVRPDGLALLASNDMIVANRESGGNVMRIAPDGSTTLFDNIAGEDCFSAAVRSNGDIYIGCLSGMVYRYVGGTPAGRVPLGDYAGGNIALEFSPDQTVLYVATSDDGNLRTVDPDSGTDTIVAGGFLATGIAVFGSECPPGNFTEYGTGLAGSGGIVPALHGTGHPAPNGSITLQVRDFVGGATSALMWGLAAGNVTGSGGTFYVSFAAPFFFVPLTLPGMPGVPGDGDLDVPATLPNDPQI